MNLFQMFGVAAVRELMGFARHGLHMVRNIGHWNSFWQDYRDYKRLSPPGDMRLFPCISDKTSETIIEPIYFYQDAWAFEKIVKFNPDEHLDVGSHHKFVALLSKVVDTTMVDIRPLSLPMTSLKFKEGSILNLPFNDGSCESVSSICVIEHIGLGRYGDPLDADGSRKAASELVRVLSPGGHLFISVPLDDINRTYFNAHRAFTRDHVLELFRPLTLVDQAFIYGNEFRSTPKAGFGTGCFEFVNANP